MATQPRPWLVRILEWVAAVLELDTGCERLELFFDGGRLVRYRLRGRWRRPDALQPFDDAAARFASRLAGIADSECADRGRLLDT